MTASPWMWKRIWFHRSTQLFSQSIVQVYDEKTPLKGVKRCSFNTCLRVQKLSIGDPLCRTGVSPQRQILTRKVFLWGPVLMVSVLLSIAVTSHERHDSNHRYLVCLFNSFFWVATKGTSHYWPFVRGIHRSSVNSPHKGPVMVKAFPWYAVIIMTQKGRSLGSRVT